MTNRTANATSGRKSYLSRRAREREEALERIREQVATGKLIIREMTPEERERYGPAKKNRNREAAELRRRKALAMFYEEHVRDEELEKTSAPSLT
jgi:hypothetical protein